MGTQQRAGLQRRRWRCREVHACSSGVSAALLAALFATLLLAPLAAADEREDAIMASVRAQLWRGIAPLMMPLAGWHPVSQHSPCAWALVTCDDQRHIVKIQLRSTDRTPRDRLSEAELRQWAVGSAASPDGPGRLADSVRLPPELAQLTHLQELELVQHMAPWEGGLPQEWLAAGAFPRLKRLVVGGQRLGGSLPPIAPGRLPALQALELQFYDEQPATLPASWGASPASLPQLRSLTVAMRLKARLPASWAAGFSRLRELTLADPALSGAMQRQVEAGPQRQTSAAEAAAAAWPAVGSAAARRVPLPTDQAAAADGTRGERDPIADNEDSPLDSAAWQAGAPSPAARPSGAAAAAAAANLPAKLQLPSAWAGGFPELRLLRVAGLNLTGPLPALWANASWPSLELLDLSYNQLHGPLPAQLFAAHQRLTQLWLDGNRFSGQLPAEWSTLKVQVLSLCSNALSGPAFPPAWLQPGSMVSLRHLLLSDNPGLSGELPPGLSWPNLRTLRLDGTGLQGSIPEAWCRSPIRLSLHDMWIRGTGINPVLPACINGRGDVGRVHLDVSDPQAQPGSQQDGPAAAGAAAGAAPASESGGVRLDAESARAPGWDARHVGSAQGQPAGAAAIVAAVVAAAAAAAVAAVGTLLYARQRRVWQQQQQWQRLGGSDPSAEGPALLARYSGSPVPARSERSSAERSSSAPSTKEAWATPAAGPVPASIAALKARLPAGTPAEAPTAAAARAAALLRAELEQWHGVIDLMPLEALPAALAQTQQQLEQLEAAEGGSVAAHRQVVAAGSSEAAAEDVKSLMPAGGAKAAPPAAAAARGEVPTPLDGIQQQQPPLNGAQQQQWGDAQWQQQPQWHAYAPSHQQQQQQQHSQAAHSSAQHSTAQHGGSSLGSLGLPPGRTSAQHSSQGMHSVRSMRSMRSRYSSSSMGGSQGQWSLQSTLLLLSPGELTIECDAQGQPVLLGHGRAAAVCLGRLGDSAVAVKAYELFPGLEPEAAWRRVSKMRGCSHPRVAEVHGAAIQGRLLLLATELLPLGSLREALQRRELGRELRWSTGGYQVAIDVAEALVFLHKQMRMRHGGLSSSNVLLSEDLRASVSDLGIAQLLAKHCGAAASAGKAPAGGGSGDGAREAAPLLAAAGPDGVAQMYAAPEQLAGQRCSTAADMYSFGILLADIVSQRPGRRRGEWRMPRAGHECPHIVVELIAACLSPDAAQRPSAEKALQVLLLTDGW